MRGTGQSKGSFLNHSHYYRKDSHLRLVPAHKPSKPTYCTHMNAGRCECAQHQTPRDKWEGVTTFTWWVAGEQRCMTRFVPRDHNLPMPVVVNVQCHAQDKLKGVGFSAQAMDLMEAANRFGFIAIGASTPHLGQWRFGNDSVVNDKDPQPCNPRDNPDIMYMRDILAHIQNDQGVYDASHVYTKGCSQNAQFAAYSAYCFSDQVAGIWQCSAGMVLKGQRPQSPRLETECTSSAFERHREHCLAKEPCPKCQYFPIYPCFNKRPMIHCISLYSDDAMSAAEPHNPVSRRTLGDSMFRVVSREGHDVRLMKFQPDGNSKNRSGHAPPMNQFDWLVGCLGVSKPCTRDCGHALKSCVQEMKIPHEEAYRRCMTHDLVVKGYCEPGCAPDIEMLKLSESPLISLSQGRWGDINMDLEPHSRPNTSLCEHRPNSRALTRFNGDKIGLEAFRAQRSRRGPTARPQSGHYLTRMGFREKGFLQSFGGNDAQIPRSQLLDGRRQFDFLRLHSGVVGGGNQNIMRA